MQQFSLIMPVSRKHYQVNSQIKFVLRSLKENASFRLLHYCNCLYIKPSEINACLSVTHSFDLL